MITSILPKKTLLLTTIAGLVTFSSVPSQASELQPLQFILRDDPNSGLDLSGGVASSVGPNNNTRLAQGFLAGNFGSESQSLGVLVPFLWPQLPNTNYAAMSWNNKLGGWYTDNFDGTSLLITLSNFSDKVPMGKIADFTGNNPLPSSSNCDPSVPSCYYPQDPSIYPIQTLKPTDAVPLLNLGLFAPGEIKSFDIAFQYQFGDNRPGTSSKTSIIAYTVSAVPEPATMAGLALAGVGMGLLRRKKPQKAKSESHIPQ